MTKSPTKEKTMLCKECGGETIRPVFRAVIPPVAAYPRTVSPARPSNCYARWACGHCGRYHFRDGTLYKNPYKDEIPD
jgi:hypothetical protein